jgi:hypothetical protein
MPASRFSFLNYSAATAAKGAPMAGAAYLTAAKMHVLHLEPIKERIGLRWGKLSDLVHKLCEVAMLKAQGPQDSFVAVGELIYIATFRGVSHAQAELVMTAVARQVCDTLFGTDCEEVSVRSLVGLIPSALADKIGTGAISDLLEQIGCETVVSKPAHLSLAAPNDRVGEQLIWEKPPISGWARFAHHSANRMGFCFRFSPIWNLEHGSSRSLRLVAISQIGQRRAAGLEQFLGANCQAQLIDMEIASLFMTAEYAQRMHDSGAVSSLTVGVSFETLSGFQSRIRYIRALRAVQVSATCPIVLKIEGIPRGAMLENVAQLVGMVRSQGIRTVLDFDNAIELPPFDIRLGVAGLGARIPESCSLKAAQRLAEKLVGRAREQKCFAFLNELNTPELLQVARESRVRFGTGYALGDQPELTGLEAVPVLPLEAIMGAVTSPEGFEQFKR